MSAIRIAAAMPRMSSKEKSAPPPKNGRARELSFGRAHVNNTLTGILSRPVADAHD